MDRCEAVVTSAHVVSALVFEMIQKRANHRRVQIGDIQRRWLRAGACDHKLQQQTERVSVAGDRVGAGFALADQPVGEERLQQRSDGTHKAPPAVLWFSRRAAAWAISSGVAVKYQ